jgi:DNA-(apurinic or apyrimidinic site) lyase
MKDNAGATTAVTQQRLAAIFAGIPWPVWEAVVRQEPEWKHMASFLPHFGFGPFAALMVAAGLADYYLRGKADLVYWPELQRLLAAAPVPRLPAELLDHVVPFYQAERDHERKIKTLRTYLTSDLARALWHDSAEKVAAQFPQFHRDLAAALARADDDNQIVFATKCLGLSLMMAGENHFDAHVLPLAGGSRLRRLTQKLNFNCAGQQALREFWNEIFVLVRKRHGEFSSLHLDSLLWQIAPLGRVELLAYFDDLGIRPLGARLVELLAQPA